LENLRLPHRACSPLLELNLGILLLSNTLGKEIGVFSLETILVSSIAYGEE